MSVSSTYSISLYALSLSKVAAILGEKQAKKSRKPPYFQDK